MSKDSDRTARTGGADVARLRDAAERVVLVDDAGRDIGSAGKLDAHANGGLLHLGFSILIFNGAGELLLQRRASAKYHFAGFWSNSCCGHPRPGEAIADAAARRLAEELGFSVALRAIDRLQYRAHDDVSGLTEHELLSVFVGAFDGQPQPAPAEVGDWRWVDRATLYSEVVAHPQRFTPWFRVLLQQPSVTDAW